MGFWWHWRGDKYLQLERAKLCFKINVPDDAQQTVKWLEWNHALMRFNGTAGIKVVKSRRKQGDCMTVAVLAADYRQPNDQGQLDFEKTVQILRDAGAFMDAAVRSQQQESVDALMTPSLIAEAIEGPVE